MLKSLKEDVMAKKKLKKKVARKPAANKAFEPVIEQAREIWLAGLGAFSVAQQEGEKIVEQGNKMFDRLVNEGNKVEKKARKRCAARMSSCVRAIRAR